ncbi:MAG: N-formylglutamate amidohydrolase [Alphaproteobacteria bacterium]
MTDYSNINILSTFNDEDIKYPIILSIPHSGTLFPAGFEDKTILSVNELRTSEDPFVDELLQPLINQGFTALKLNISRSIIDVNRDKLEIDKHMFFDYPQEEVDLNSRRSRLGHGVIPRINSENKSIYKDKISYNDALTRIEKIYNPYHAKLSELINKTKDKFGWCLVLDMHSMPSKVCNIMIDEKQVDFCVSTLFEQSAPKEIWETFGSQLSLFDYRVEYNRPYSGGFITFNYCQPKDKVHTMQLEINRSLYIDEKSFEKKPTFETLKEHLTQSVLGLLK